MDTNKVVFVTVAAVFGFTVGVNTGKQDPRGLEEVEERLAAVEAQVVEAVSSAGAAKSAAEAAAETAVESASATDPAVTALGEQIAGVAAGLAALRDGQETMVAAAAGGADRVEALAGELAALSNAVEAQGAATTSVSEAVAALAARPVPAPVPAAEPAAPVLAEAPPAAPEAEAAPMPEADLTLGFGQTAKVGDARVFLSRMKGSDAILRVAGLGDVAVGPAGGAAALGNGCTLSLNAMIDRIAYLDYDCSGEPAAAAAAAEGSMGEPFSLSPGTTATVGETRVFFSRTVGDEAKLRVAGLGDVSLRPGGSVAIGGGCALGLEELEGRGAQLASNCDVIAPEVTLARAPAASDAVEAEEAEAPVAEGGIVLGIGQAAPVGDSSIYFSRRSGDDVVLVVRGRDPITVGPKAGSASVGGCTVSLVGQEGRKAIFRADC
ncbi:MAG: hypothetical protein AAGG47_03470 [Pseudomonadota bacterium]